MKGFVSITIARRQSFACVIQPLNDRNFRYCWSMAFNSKAGTIARWASWNAYGISIKFHSLKRVSRSELGQFSGLQNMSFCKLTRRFWLHHLKKIDSVRGILGLRCSHDKDLSFRGVFSKSNDYKRRNCKLNHPDLNTHVGDPSRAHYQNGVINFQNVDI